MVVFIAFCPYFLVLIACLISSLKGTGYALVEMLFFFFGCIYRILSLFSSINSLFDFILKRNRIRTGGDDFFFFVVVFIAFCPYFLVLIACLI